ncbi:hypothetical protein SEMRO_3487_G348530.1 [Seminavis robusta]|uniref:Uncharacterized protein n=1 Tax=Seminavis robusta TaxID=568900 RepID=A0A9N8HZE3_9STRA|nr:hypothetical protein SEMRO_3487_G348530.1 [Seminavis robusta]|eukprot:Sro3487_g348530.1 n/a (98) ;mRNA; r:6090-6383
MASTTDKVATDKVATEKVVATEEIVEFISGDILSEDGREDFVQLEAQMRKGMEHGNGVTDNDVADGGVDEEQEKTKNKNKPLPLPLPVVMTTCKLMT